MDSTTVSPSSQLLYILNHQLIADELAASVHVSTPVLDVVDHAQLVSEADKEAISSEKAQSAIHRWNLRITSLTGSKIAGAQATGFQLALQTAQQSESLYLQNARAWFNAALAVVSRKNPASLDGFSAAADFLLYSFDKARFLPEFAREVANAGAIRKFGEALLNCAGNEGCDIETRVAALDFISELIVISASPLRPLSQHIQNVAVGLLCTWSADETLVAASRSAIRLLGSVYIVAGKAQAGQSWRKTVESICGSVHLLLHTLASTTIEEQGLVASLAPLDMPPIASTSSNSGLQGQAESLHASRRRLQALIDVLIHMLATPTERPVPVPVATLVKLCQRMLNLTVYSPLKERHDTALRVAQIGLLPILHTNACRLLAQIVTSAGIHLTGDSTQLLTLLSFVEGSYPAGSPVRNTLFAVSSLIVAHVPVHPDEAVRPLTKIVQAILRDAASLVDPEEGRKAISTNDSSKSGQKQDSRKTKRAKLFEADQVMSGRKRTSLAEAELIDHSLSSLHRIILHGAWLFPAALLNQTLRLLLAYGLSGQFLNAIPDYAPNALLSEGLSFCPAIRMSILRCLQATLQTIAKEAHGTVELALAVFEQGLQSPILDEEGRNICTQAIGMVDNMIRPVVPPLVKSAALRQATRDLTGGSVLGKEVDHVETDEPAANYAEVHEEGQDGPSLQNAQAPLNGFQAAGLSMDKPATLETRATTFKSSAAPSAKDVNFVAFGKTATSSAQPTEAIVQQDDLEARSPDFGGMALGTSDRHEAVGSSSKRRLESTTYDSEFQQLKPVQQASEVVVDDEQEPERRFAGGRQAELAAVKWDKPEDSDTSDDDAPMPTIHMSDDSEDDVDED